jgi:Tfp pilus assembly protein PilF
LCEQLALSWENADLDDFDVQMEVSTFNFRYAEMLKEADRDEDAVVRYEAALALNGSHLPSLRAVGPFYIAQEKWPKAERVFRQLLQLTGGHGDSRQVAATYTQLGIVERALGRMEKAQRRFNKALEIEANYVPALKGLALIHEDRGDWTTLLNIYNNIIIYHATVPADVIHAYMTKGRILDEHLHRPDKAVQHYERSLAFDAHQPSALLRLAELALRSDDWNVVIDLVQRGLGVSPNAHQRGTLLLARSLAHEKIEARELAIRDYEAAVEVDAELKQDGEDPLADVDALKALVAARLPR